jgi:iron complex transport system permease protein
MSHRSFSYLSGRINGRYAPATMGVALYLCVLLLAVFALSLASGSYDLTPTQLLQLLWEPSESVGDTVLWQLRMPRYLVACLVGAMFALSGALLQNVTRKPLADPSLVGVSQGASLAVVALIVLWPDVPIWARPGAAFGGGIGAALLVQLIASGPQSSASLRFILVGIGVASLISAGTSAMLTYGQINQAMSALGWLAGSVHTATWDTALIMAVVMLALLPALIWSARPLSALRFGHELSTGLGVNFTQSRFVIVTLAVALASVAVAAAGPMGFVGLLAPQLAQRLTRAGTGSGLVLSALTGALIVACADLLGRVLFAPIQLPAGLVSSVIGAPVFVYLILKQAAPGRL